MSLHDMYFSKKNKNYIFSVIKDLILREKGYNINDNEEYIDIYRVKYPLIFERVNTDNLSYLNKCLIDEVGELLINDINTKNFKKIINNPSEKINFQEKNEIENLKEIYINSSKRTRESTNRYNYNVILDNIKKFIFKEITLPEENNILFNDPLIYVEITTKNNQHKFYCKMKEKLQLNSKIYITYYPSKEYEIECDNNIKIEIKNNNLETIKNNDKLPIKKIMENQLFQNGIFIKYL